MLKVYKYGLFHLQYPQKTFSIIADCCTLGSHLSCRQSHKVVDCFGNSFPKHSDDNSSNIFISNPNVKEHLQKEVILLNNISQDEKITNFLTLFLLMF